MGGGHLPSCLCGTFSPVQSQERGWVGTPMHDRGTGPPAPQELSQRAALGGKVAPTQPGMNRLRPKPRFEGLRA